MQKSLWRLIPTSEEVIECGKLHLVRCMLKNKKKANIK